jgi:hypothetical protein
MVMAEIWLSEENLLDLWFKFARFGVGVYYFTPEGTYTEQGLQYSGFDEALLSIFLTGLDKSLLVVVYCNNTEISNTLLIPCGTLEKATTMKQAIEGHYDSSNLS